MNSPLFVEAVAITICIISSAACIVYGFIVIFEAGSGSPFQAVISFSLATLLFGMTIMLMRE